MRWNVIVWCALPNCVKFRLPTSDMAHATACFPSIRCLNLAEFWKQRLIFANCDTIRYTWIKCTWSIQVNQPTCRCATIVHCSSIPWDLVLSMTWPRPPLVLKSCGKLKACVLHRTPQTFPVCTVLPAWHCKTCNYLITRCIIASMMPPVSPQTCAVTMRWSRLYRKVPCMMTQDAANEACNMLCWQQPFPDLHRCIANLLDLSSRAAQASPFGPRTTARTANDLGSTKRGSQDNQEMSDK